MAHMSIARKESSIEESCSETEERNKEGDTVSIFDSNSVTYPDAELSAPFEGALANVEWDATISLVVVSDPEP